MIKLVKKIWYKVMMKRAHQKLVDAYGFQETWYWANEWNDYSRKLSKL